MKLTSPSISKIDKPIPSNELKKEIAKMEKSIQGMLEEILKD